MDPGRAEQIDDQNGINRLSAIETLYLKQLKVTHRARARTAMRWRPRLLKALAMSCELTLALKVARVCYNTVRSHERNDPDFAAQLKEAEEEGAELLHDVTFKAALEGELEHVYWKGQVVGHVRKIDNRLRIEMLRAHMPKKFTAPGTKIAINAGSGNQINGNVLTIEDQDEMIQARQRALRKIAETKGLPVPAGIAE
jgi:hypothetical protein